ncbi:MAG TPA: hypothetical protein VF450_21525, partial [Noviherbaspirillum sp.]
MVTSLNGMDNALHASTNRTLVEYIGGLVRYARGCSVKRRKVKLRAAPSGKVKWKSLPVPRFAALRYHFATIFART